MSDEDLIKDYIERLRVELVRLGVKDAEEVLLEIRGHLMERRAGDGLTSALDALGPPEAYAASFAGRSGRQGSRRRLSVLFARLAVLCTSALLFLISVILIALDLADPGRVGFWVSSIDTTFYLGRYSGDDPSVNDVLGGFFLPIALGAALLTAALIFHQGKACIRTQQG